MTKIRVLRDQTIPPYEGAYDEVVAEYGEDAANAAPIEPGTVIENARLSTWEDRAFYSHPISGWPYYSDSGDFEVIE